MLGSKIRNLNPTVRNLSQTTNRFVIRDAQPKDCGQMCSMVYALAKYLKLEQSVEWLDSKKLAEDGFGEEHAPRFRAVVADLLDGEICTGSIAGMALFEEQYSTWKGRYLWLDNLWVSEDHQRQGIGEALFWKVVSVAAEEKFPSMHWDTLAWNVDADEFYRKQGAINIFRSPENSLVFYKLTEDQYSKSTDNISHGNDNGRCIVFK